MKTSVIALIVVLLCCCQSFGNGDNRIDHARKCVHNNYGKLRPFSKNPHTMGSKDTVYRHLTEVMKKEKTGDRWLQEKIGCSTEHLSNPPDVSMSEDELKVTAEYHLWQSGWYYVRFITLIKATEDENRARTHYPAVDLCRKAASIAFKHSKKHRDLYLKYFQALDEEARQNIMEEIKFPNYVDYKNHEKMEMDALLRVRNHLKSLIKHLLKGTTSMDLSALKSAETIRTLMTLNQMAPIENFMSQISNYVSVEDFSLQPNKASRTDREFVDMGWLLNWYRSLWYETRHNDFLKFLRHQKEGLTAGFIRRVEEAIDLTNKLSQQYKSLCHKYYNTLKNIQPEAIVIAETSALASDFMNSGREIHTSNNEGPEKLQWRGKRKRTALKKVSTRKYKCFEADMQTGQQAKKRKFSDADQSNEVEQTSCFMEGIQHSTMAVPHNSDLQLGANLGHFDQQPQVGTAREWATPETDCVTEDAQHEKTQELSSEPRSINELPYDYISTDEESYCQTHLRHGELDSLITNNGCPSSASNIPVEDYYQGEFPLPNDENQLEIDDIRVTAHENLLDIEELLASESSDCTWSKVDRWLKDNVERIADISAVNEMRNSLPHETGAANQRFAFWNQQPQLCTKNVELGVEDDLSYDEEFLQVLYQPSLENCQVDDFITKDEALPLIKIEPVEHCQSVDSLLIGEKQHETDASNLGYAQIARNDCAGDRQGSVECITSAAVCGQERAHESESEQIQRYPDECHHAYRNYQTDPLIHFSSETLSSNHFPNTILKEDSDQLDLAH